LHLTYNKIISFLRLKNSAAPSFDCIEMNYKIAADTVRTRFIVICPLDAQNTGSSPDITTTTLGLTFAKFTVPIYFGSAGASP